MSEVQAEVTISQMNAAVEKVWNLRLKELEISAEKKKLTAELDVAEKEMLALLEANELTTFKGTHGTVTASYRKSWKIPRTEEARAALFEHLKALGLYDSMIGVNSATLNSFCNEQFDKAIEEGKTDFSVPGIEEPSLTPILKFSRSA